MTSSLAQLMLLTCIACEPIRQPSPLGKTTPAGVALCSGLPVLRQLDRLDNSADRDAGPLVDLAHRVGRRSFIDRKHHLLTRDEDAGDVADERSLSTHLFYCSPVPG